MIVSLEAARPAKKSAKKRKFPTGHFKWHLCEGKCREQVYLSQAAWVKIERGLHLRYYHNLSEMLEQLAARWGAEDCDRTAPIEDTILHMVGQGVQKRQGLADEMPQTPRAEIDAWVDALISRGLLEEVQEKASSAQTRGTMQKLLILPGDT